MSRCTVPTGPSKIPRSEDPKKKIGSENCSGDCVQAGLRFAQLSDTTVWKYERRLMTWRLYFQTVASL